MYVQYNFQSKGRRGSRTYILPSGSGTNKKPFFFFFFFFFGVKEKEREINSLLFIYYSYSGISISISGEKEKKRKDVLLFVSWERERGGFRAPIITSWLATDSN
jgi:hypothetical protein